MMATDYINVMDHGAVGDAFTDDTAAISAAIAQANGEPQESTADADRDDTETVRAHLERGEPLPPGTYVVKGTIVVR